MKRSMFILMALLLATPALGAVTITCSDEGSGVVAIYYNSGTDAVRAFALDVTIDSECTTISNVTDYTGGEGNKYGIFPGSIDLSDVNNPVWGTPVAPSDDPGAEGTGLGTSRVILEMGTLYETTAPTSSGMLCKLHLVVVEGTTCHVSIAVETTRGGVVLENGTSVSITSTGCYVVFPASGPPCWDDSQCHGDANGDNVVNTADWPALRDSWLKSYPDGSYNPCGDFTRDGTVNTADWPAMRDNWLKTVPSDCTPGGTWPPS
jgi:hypothetical protein